MYIKYSLIYLTMYNIYLPDLLKKESEIEKRFILRI